MNLDGRLEPRALAELVRRLYHEGTTSLNQGNPLHASIWYAQCLNTIRQLGDNEDFMSKVLFDLGKAQAYLAPPGQAVACFEAAAYIQTGVGSGETEADCIHMAGTAIAMLEDYPRAQRLLDQAAKMYRNLELGEKARTVQKALAEVSAQAEVSLEGVTLTPHDFIIHIGGRTLAHFKVSSSGKVKWIDEDVDASDLAAPMGLTARWQVTCTTL
ncbi:MAG: hypothetical protein JXB47_18710 [Anaerolineae bacterium]|nr:hypothetical protein [Anaerolineae bacterium]